MNIVLKFALNLSLILLSLSAIMVFIRLLIGPTLPDRVLAIDVMSVLVVCIIAIFTIISKHTIYLDIVIALSLITFLGTVAFAQFIEWQLGNKMENRDD
jgi:multicomponent Na+:H+ antiporter subunit F